MGEKKLDFWLFVAGAFVVGLLAGGGILLLTQGGGPVGKGVISLYPTKASAAGNDWLVKIDDYAITKAEFEEGYKYFLAQVPEAQRASLPDESVIKRQYFENLIAQYVIDIKALNDGIHKSPEGELLLKTALRQAIYQIYLQKNLPQDKSGFMPSKVEIDQYYMQNKAQFDKLGMKADQIKQYAIQEISQRKMQEWVATFIATKKESFKVQRNESLIQKDGLNGMTTTPSLFPQTGQ